MTDNEDLPAIDSNKPPLNLDIPPVAIILIGASGYVFVLLVIFIIRYMLRTKGFCQSDLCDCGSGLQGCCDCIEGVADACSCGTPTIDKCLDACCPKRKLDCVGIILCQCCASSDRQCCGEGPCCSYGDLECNCACIQPDFDRVNCLCCQLGTNYNRDNLDY